MEAATRKPVKKRWVLWAAFLLPVCAVLALVGLTAARYVVSTHENAPAVAAEFYFTSDKLTAAGDAHTVVWWDTAAPLEIKFQVKNAKDSLNVTREPITYVLSALSDQPGAACGYPTQPQTLAPGDADPGVALVDSHTVKLTKTGDLPERFTVTVKAAASAPYTAEIRAVYTVLVAKGGTTSAVTDAQGRLAAEWTIAVGAEFGGGDDLPVTLHWPVGVAPDPSDPIFKGAVPSGNSASVLLPTGGVHRVLFYKTDPAADFSGSKAFTFTLK